MKVPGWLKDFAFGRKCEDCHTRTMQGWNTYECVNPHCLEYGKIKDKKSGREIKKDVVDNI